MRDIDHCFPPSFGILVLRIIEIDQEVCQLVIVDRNGSTMPHVIIWDIETVPGLRGFAAAKGLDGKSDDEIRDAIGDKFPNHIYQSIACIGDLIAR